MTSIARNPTPVDSGAGNDMANALRLLAADGVQKANSGHPGLPMGCAEIGVLLYGEILKHYPQEPGWVDRDRFVLSAGHGSMLLYSLLHLSGYDLPMEELQQFRQLGSRTPGHPEYGLTAGVETTTGPLGQGISNAVGMAMAERMLAARFNTDKHAVVDHYTYVLAGDGDMMEGVSSESCSLAGHLGLGKLIVFYDSNRITIEGSTDLAFTEDVGRRFQAYGWQTFEGDAYDTKGILDFVVQAKAEPKRPSLILLHSVIGKGAPTLAGSHETHGSPLGEEEIRAAKKAMGIAEDSRFHVPAAAREYFDLRRDSWGRGTRAGRGASPSGPRRIPTGGRSGIASLRPSTRRACRSRSSRWGRRWPRARPAARCWPRSLPPSRTWWAVPPIWPLPTTPTSRDWGIFRPGARKGETFTSGCGSTAWGPSATDWPCTAGCAPTAERFSCSPTTCVPRSGWRR